MAADILVVDDETDIRDLVAGILEDEGYETRTASNSDSALAAIRDRKPTLAFLDIWLQGSTLDGLEVLDEVKRIHPDLPIVMISGHGNIETAVSAIKRGAYDFIEKPFKSDRLLLLADRALEAHSLKKLTFPELHTSEESAKGICQRLQRCNASFFSLPKKILKSNCNIEFKNPYS